MSRVLVVSAEGPARVVANAVGRVLTARGIDVDVVDAGRRYDRVVVAEARAGAGMLVPVDVAVGHRPVATLVTVVPRSGALVRGLVDADDVATVAAVIGAGLRRSAKRDTLALVACAVVAAALQLPMARAGIPPPVFALFFAFAAAAAYFARPREVTAIRAALTFAAAIAIVDGIAIDDAAIVAVTAALVLAATWCVGARVVGERRAPAAVGGARIAA